MWGTLWSLSVKLLRRETLASVTLQILFTGVKNKWCPIRTERCLHLLLSYVVLVFIDDDGISSSGHLAQFASKSWLVHLPNCTLPFFFFFFQNQTELFLTSYLLISDCYWLNSGWNRTLPLNIPALMLLCFIKKKIIPFLFILVTDVVCFTVYLSNNSNAADLVPVIQLRVTHISQLWCCIEISINAFWFKFNYIAAVMSLPASTIKKSKRLTRESTPYVHPKEPSCLWTTHH